MKSVSLQLKKNTQQGMAMLISVFFFLAILVTIVLGIAVPITKQIQIGNELYRSKQSYFLAAAGVEEALYRLQEGMNITSGDTLAISGQSTTMTVTNTTNGRTIESNADYNDAFRKIRAEVIAGIGTSFNYGVQSGNGGFVMSNNSGVYGNVYSNGDIIGASGVFITGSAIAANSFALTNDQANDAPATPPSSITFRNTNSTQDLAQSFQVSSTSPINKVSFNIRKVGSPSNATVRIVTDNAGAPSTNTIDTGTLSASAVTTVSGWVDVGFVTNVQLNQGDTYWVILDNSSVSSSDYYIVSANSTYSNGQARVGQYGGTWNSTSPTGLDSYFRVYLGGTTSIINDVTVGSAGVGDARANTVTNSTIAGTLYCQTGSGNNKSCNTSLPDPVAVPLPISEGNIAQWKYEAETGGIYTGTRTINNSSTSMGPLKITGDLMLENSARVTMTGTIWVEGDLTLDNGSEIRLASGYSNNSSTIVVDGNINILNNSNFSGSGVSGSYILVLSTSDCPMGTGCSGANAIDVSNNAGTVILNAQNGYIHFSNNAGAKEATAYKILLDNNAYVTYDSGLANVNFTSGPSGGWNITSWKEVE
jgi:hypothetical protein